MANKQRFYAVKKGRMTGIFTTWEECLEATKGFSSPEYKSFESEEAAQAYLNNEDIVYKNEIQPRLANNEVVAFVDGSYDAEKRVYGYGAYIIAPNINEHIELCGKGQNEKYIELRNTAGEIIAVFNAVDWTWKNGFTKISIFYDYDGLEKWANNSWTAKTNLSRFYQNFIAEKRDLLQISFVKVAGHSNNIYNDRADALAKGAIATNKVMRDNKGNGGYIINGVKNADVTYVLDKLKAESSGFSYESATDERRTIYTVNFNDDKLTLQVFNNIKLMVQGKISNVFQIVTTSIIENIDCGDFIKILQQAYGLSIDSSKVDKAYQTKLPNISRKALPANLSILLKQSIIDLENSAYNDVEFSKYTFAVLKALEGVLKLNLNKANIPMPTNSFNMFDKKGGVFVLQNGYRHIDNDSIVKIENCYNHLFNQRHTLFHFGIILGEKDQNTRMINSKKEANDIIENTLQLIDENFID